MLSIEKNLWEKTKTELTTDFLTIVVKEIETLICNGTIIYGWQEETQLHFTK